VPLWQTERDFPGDDTAVGLARTFCTDRLRRLMGPDEAALDLISTSELVVSELVTNAVRAASSQISVRLTVDDYNLVVAVRDNAAGRPEPRHASPSDVDGRGLAIISAVSNAWGVSGEQSAKTVWAEFCLSPTLVALAFADDGEQSGSEPEAAVGLDPAHSGSRPA
jgi:anti-sigma regulatory factor (Ser/Thr protein kinase)